MQPVHERMPLILQPDDFPTWLDREAPMETINPLIRPSDGMLLQMHPVSTAVGNVGNDSSELIATLSTPA
jgi:putative SOS response-associated peptidase YedK